MKRMIALITAVMMLGGCIPHSELDKIGIAESVGVDFDGSGYTITVQYFNTDASGGVTAVDSSASNVMVVSASGKSIESALEALAYTTGCDTLFGAAAVIVFGRDALPALKDALDLAASHYSGNLRALITAAYGKASDIMDVKFTEGNASVEKLEDIVRNAETLGLSRPVRMYEAMEKLSGASQSVVLPMLMPYDAQNDLTDEKSGSLIISGGALCTGGRYATELTVREMSGLAVLDPSPESVGNCEMTLTDRGEDTRVMLYNIKSQVTPSLHEGKLLLGIELSAECKIVSTSLSDPSAARDSISRLCEEELSARVAAVLDKTLRSHGADASDLEYAIRSHSPDLWKTVSHDLRTALSEAQYTVSCRVRTERFGILGHVRD